MSDFILDDSLIGRVEPLELLRFLHTQGWRDVFNQERTVYLEAEVNGVVDQIVLPTNREMRGYYGQMREVFDQLSDLLNLTPNRIVQATDSLVRDIHYIGINQPLGQSRIRVRNMEDCVEGIKDWVLSSATLEATEEPRLIQAPRKPDRAIQFLDSVEIDHTLPGSYVFPVHVVLPLIAEREMTEIQPQLDLGIPEAPQPPSFQRLASARMYESVSAVLKAAREVEQGAGFDVFESAANAGISANLLEGLGQFSGNEDLGFRLSVDWAKDYPREDSSPLAFTPGDMTIVREAAKRIRERVPEDNVRFRGNVTRLHRERALGPGEITVAGSLVESDDGLFRRLQVELGEDDYRQAVRAHDAGNDVILVGSIRRGPRWRMVQLEGLTIVPLEN